MIGKLKGLVETIGDDHVLIDVNGVCYIAFCSSRTLQNLPRVGEGCALFVEMIVREDMIRLYGFGTEVEKSWFLLLTTVQGVGARVAQAILATLTPNELSSAIALQDKVMMGRANGVGPKLAQRIVTELKGKVPQISGVSAGVVELQTALGEGNADSAVVDAVSALTNLGYTQAHASASVALVISRDGDGLPTEKLIRLGLRELAKN